MRIIAGQFRGHRLVAFKAGHIRPTTDRVKESLFNRLQAKIPGAKVLDLFSGTGSLGLEALSRGAEHVQFVDSHPKSIGILKKNVQLLKVEGIVSISQADVRQFLKTLQAPYDLIFIDPPFTKKMADQVMADLASSKAFGPETTIAIESSHQEEMKDEYLPLVLLDRKEFGDKTLSLFQPKED
ncbi:MAG: 16S rRNA (guanine(966)-N(2))-methyltransferase RsmD [Bdellovibrionales bacterium]|nr:16S rRNA (guanine(966)-N(2))-methyltransferase RsmD [Bdellovibrionales bacterium]